MNHPRGEDHKEKSEKAVPAKKEVAAESTERSARRGMSSKFSVRHFAGTSSHVESLSQLRVAHLTDLHVGRVTPIKVHHEAARRTNELKPDLVVITGDFVCHSHKYLEQLEDVIKKIEAPIIAVLGNHDHWSGAGEVVKAVERGGAEFLSNAHTTITIRGQRLQVVGVDDAYTGHADSEQATKGLRPDLPTLGLSHIGEEAEQLWERGVPLVLSGHTHAGQITVARLHEIAVGRIARHRYIHGLYGSRSKDMSVYVGAGVGAAVMPLRLGRRSQREITVFELGAEPASINEDHTEQKPYPAVPKAPKAQRKSRGSKS